MVNRESQRRVRCVATLLAGLLIFGTGCGQEEFDDETVRADPDPSDEIEVEESKDLGQSETKNEIGKLKQGKKGKALDKRLTDDGFEPGGDPKDFHGQRIKYKHPDKPNVKFTHTLVVQNYKKKGGTDTAALASVTLTSKEGNETQTTTYDFALVAPGGDLEETKELTATEEGTVVPANSWWSCVTNRLYSRCVGVCTGSIPTCAATSYGSYTLYIGCLAINCGLCLTKAIACCSCDCSWWCSWGAGCCDR
jgi:hypothetical protein